jgi:hypothetical protein
MPYCAGGTTSGMMQEESVRRHSLVQHYIDWGDIYTTRRCWTVLALWPAIRLAIEYSMSRSILALKFLLLQGHCDTSARNLTYRHPRSTPILVSHYFAGSKSSVPMSPIPAVDPALRTVNIQYRGLTPHINYSRDVDGVLTMCFTMQGPGLLSDRPGGRSVAPRLQVLGLSKNHISGELAAVTCHVGSSHLRSISIVSYKLKGCWDITLTSGPALVLSVVPGRLTRELSFCRSFTLTNVEEGP